MTHISHIKPGVVPLGLGSRLLQGITSYKTITEAMATSGVRVPLVSARYFEALSRNSTTEIWEDLRKKEKKSKFHTVVNKEVSWQLSLTVELSIYLCGLSKIL